MTTFLLLLAAMAAVAGFAYWIGWDNRGDVEERRRWENRPTREAADRVLAAGFCTMDGPARPPVCGEVCDTCPIPMASPTATGDTT